VCFSSLFVGFSCAARFAVSEEFVFSFVSEDHVSMSCASLIVLDLDPSNAGFGLRFVDFWLEP
jgi:hypothetical protein